MTFSKSAIAKRRPLSLAQLSAYDDILTDALVDHVYYWTTVPKNRPSYHPSRGIREEEVSKIIHEEIIVHKDLESGEERLLATDGLKRFRSSLGTDKERDGFQSHLRRYIRMYLPDCPWEVSSTNRYTIVTHEACVVARTYIRRNETIKYLSGIQVVITPDEEKEISSRKKDFSIVVSSRNKCTSLFMGPARFANHDCEANAKLITTSHSEIEIVATRPIGPGEEITVTYGDSYFGVDNSECLCLTCEKALRNGWEPKEGSTSVRASHEEKRESYLFRRRHREESMASSRTPSVTPDIRPRILKAKGRTKLSKEPVETSNPVSPTPEMICCGQKRDRDHMATPPTTPAKNSKPRQKPESSLLPSKPAASESRDSFVTTETRSHSGNAQETDVTSPDKDSPNPDHFILTPLKSFVGVPRFPNSGSMPLEPRSPQSLQNQVTPPVAHQKAAVPEPPVDQAAIARSTMSLANILNGPFPVMKREPEISITPSIEIIQKGDELVPEVRPQPRKYQRRVFLRQSTPPARARTLGDYLLTPLLLSEPDMAWIQCTNCTNHFVQQNAYFTRSSCPRCERHSKLYGFAWPKTERAGPGDKEERVLDHRTIHRFLDPNDERRARGRKLLYEGKLSVEPKKGRKIHRKRTDGAVETPRPEINKGSHDFTGVRRSGRMRRLSSRLSEAIGN